MKTSHERIRFWNNRAGKHQFIIICSVDGKIVKHYIEG